MKVSVAIVTYNHEEFIAKALDSVLMQTTNFEYEIIVGEDCSSDNTRTIILDYMEMHPDKIRLMCNEKNLGAHRNAEQTLQACKGDYVALLDGDDYWISSNKLQKQADFLDIHPECVLCFHDALICYKDGSKEPTRYRPSQKEFVTVEDLLLDNFIPTSSVMYRSGTVAKVPEWIGVLKMGDWPIYMLYALHGTIGYIDETMSVYAVHHGGVWSMKGVQDQELAIIELFETLGTHLDTKYSGIISRILRWRYFRISEHFENSGNISDARIYAIKSILKHVSIIFHSNQRRLDLPDYMTSVKSAKLIKCILRLYLVPFFRTYVAIIKPRAPSLYRFLRAGYCRILGLFGIRSDGF